ncbi:MAG: hypothetical protein AAFY53_10245 [Pseudomonadota bacterium]
MKSFRRKVAMSAATIAVAASVGSVAMTGAAHAQANCATYAKLALQQQRQNVQKACKFDGPSWSSDVRAHQKWCASVGPDLWKAELQKRAKMLAENCS